MTAGDTVRIVTPDNPRLHGAQAVVASVEEWGCHLKTRAAATGRFRAHWTEMEFEEDRPLREVSGKVKKAETTGNCCPGCGGWQLVRTGSCVTCQDCGHNEGCG
jgi:hypothetical protein